MPSLLTLTVAIPLLLRSAAARSSQAASFCATSGGGGGGGTAATSPLAGGPRRRRRRRRAGADDDDDRTVRRGRGGGMTTADDRDVGGDAPITTLAPRGRTYTVLDDDRRDDADAGGDDDRRDDGQRRRRRLSSRRRDMQLVLRTMERAAYLAGEVALSTSGKIDVRSTKANSRDLVTQSDLECQRLVRDVVMSEFPNDAFLGEEDVDDDDEDDAAGVGGGGSRSGGGGGSIANADALRGSLDIVDVIEDEERLLFIVVGSIHCDVRFALLCFCLTYSDHPAVIEFRILLMARRTFKLVRDLGTRCSCRRNALCPLVLPQYTHQCSVYGIRCFPPRFIRLAHLCSEHRRRLALPRQTQGGGGRHIQPRAGRDDLRGPGEGVLLQQRAHRHRRGGWWRGGGTPTAAQESIAGPRRGARQRGIPRLPRVHAPRVRARRVGPRHEGAGPTHGRVRLPGHGVGGAGELRLLLQLGPERVGRRGGDGHRGGGGRFR